MNPNSNPNPFPLPPNLPVPVDDGAARHLPGMRLPDCAFPSTAGRPVNLSALPGLAVLFVYPMTGRPGVPLPDGWDAIPGARGCTPQACGFRSEHGELARLGSAVHGLSTQDAEYQREVRDRLHLPYELISDRELVLKAALRLPTFTVAGMELYKRITLVLLEGRIEKVFYPVFPPDRNAAEVREWMERWVKEKEDLAG